MINGNGTPLQYSCLENPMDGGAWQAVVHGVAKSRTRLNDFTFTFLFLKFKFIYLNWRLITLQYCIGFAVHQHESATGVYVSPILNSPPNSPPYPIPLGHPSATAPSILYTASNLDWRLVSYMILYMFQCHSCKQSHLLPLPQSPKDCSIHLWLFCCLTYRVIITIFLNSIYMPQYTVLVFFFLAHFTRYNWLQFHPPHQNGFKCILFNG